MLLPNFMACSFEKNSSEGEHDVILLGEKQKVKSEDILLIKTPRFTQPKSLTVFNEESKKWEPCKLTQITKKEYNITWT